MSLHFLYFKKLKVSLQKSIGMGIVNIKNIVLNDARHGTLGQLYGVDEKISTELFEKVFDIFEENAEYSDSFRDYININEVVIMVYKDKFINFHLDLDNRNHCLYLGNLVGFVITMLRMGYIE